jgi:hypothetical protein
MKHRHTRLLGMSGFGKVRRTHSVLLTTIIFVVPTVITGTSSIRVLAKFSFLVFILKNEFAADCLAIQWSYRKHTTACPVVSLKSIATVVCGQTICNIHYGRSSMVNCSCYWFWIDLSVQDVVARHHTLLVSQILLKYHNMYALFLRSKHYTRPTLGFVL